ncbi:MAG TPA: sigma-70 family RNA polymerase sigma factor [Tepidisphaeraceae bacterium]|jgi:RNA polymerase sigma-70 factor (ECF subfamily)
MSVLRYHHGSSASSSEDPRDGHDGSAGTGATTAAFAGATKTMAGNPATSDVQQQRAARSSRYASLQAQQADGGRSDEQLMADYRAGDSRSFAELVKRYERELYHFLVRFMGDRVAAEDVFQEAFLQVHQSAEQFDPQRRFRPWLFTIAANKARDVRRSQARRPANALQASIAPNDEEGGEFIDLMEAVDALPERPMERQELQQSVQKAVMSMPDHLREILLLSYFHEFPYKQIGEILDIPLGTVKSRLHAAVAYFADRWKAANKNGPSA